jgi:hypothetical protein
VGEEKKRPNLARLLRKADRAANVGRDFVIKNVALDEGTRMKALG